MKKIIIITCFIFSFVTYGGLIAQNNNAKSEKSIDTSPSTIEPYKSNTNKKFNSIDPFVGVWTLESKVVDNLGKVGPTYPGYFMVVDSDGSYKIFVYNNRSGGILTSEGKMVVESNNVLIEHIKHHINFSLIGKSNRIEYKVENDRYYKTFFIEKDMIGGEYNRQEHEIWKRVRMPEVDNSRTQPMQL